MQASISAAVVVVIFAFAFPKPADYSKVWAEIGAMTWIELSTLALLAVWNIVTYWFVMVASLPGSNYWQAMKVNQTSTAVANTVPGGGALGIGVTYGMYSVYGFTRSEIALSILVSGIWNNFVKLSMPVIALALVAIQGNASAGSVAASLVGVAVVFGAVFLFALTLRSDRLARRVGSGLGTVALYLRWRRGAEARKLKSSSDRRGPLFHRTKESPAPTRRLPCRQMNRRGSLISALIGVGILLASGCTSGSDPQSRGPDDASAMQPIVVGSFDFSESRILAEVYASALEHHGYPVKRLSKVASREIMEPALDQEFVDLVPEYQGTALAFLSRSSAPAALDPQATHALLAETLAPRGITVLDFASAQDRNEVAVARSTADRLGVETISDLQDVASEMVLGGPPECPGRPLCLQGLEDVYGLNFEAFLPLDAGGPLTVAALEGGEIDVAILFTTSPAILAKDFVVLEDDLHLQPAENVVPIVREQILDIHGPELAHLLNSVTARLSTKTLRELNQRVELEHEDPAAVARDWLDHEGLDR